MALPIYIEVEAEKQGKFESAVTRKGREKMIEGFAVTHHIDVPTDPLTGQATGSRVHRAFTFVKEIDKTSPQFFQALCSNESIKSMIVHFYAVGKDGIEKEFYSITLKDAMLSGIKTILPHVHTDGEQKAQEEVSLRYGEIEWKILDGNITAHDAWMIPAGA